MTNTEFLTALGIETFEVNAPSVVKTTKCLVVTNETFNNAELELLQKMLAAINIAQDEYVVTNDITSYRYKIVFTVHYSLGEDMRHFVLESPKDILANPQLKKNAWATLQRAQKLL